MSARTRSKRRRSGRVSVHKANGVLHSRVQKVGPERFGIVCVDVGKAKSDWMLCDFYGKVHVARHFCSAELIRDAKVEGLKRSLKQAQIRTHQAVLQRVVSWASNAALAADSTDLHQRIWFTLDDDRAAKTLEIQALERDVASLLVQTPYVLLLSHPGINVVTAGEVRKAG